MTTEEWRRFVWSELGPTVREWKPDAVRPIDEVTAAQNRRILCEAMDDSTDTSEAI